MARDKHNTINIEHESGARVELRLEPKPGLDIDGEAAMSKVIITADVGYEDGRIGTDPRKDDLLVGATVSTDPSSSSVLGQLREKLRERFGGMVGVELLKEEPMIRGLRSQKGEKVYEAVLYPIPEGVTAARFEKGVRDVLNDIKIDMQPRLPESRHH